MIPRTRSLFAGRWTQAVHRGTAVAFLVAILAACSDSTAPEQATDGPYWDPSQDQIFFVSTRAGNVDSADQPLGDIYRMNADGTGAQRLTEESGAYRDLEVSPDGTEVAYYSDQSGCYNVWVINVDGTDDTQLTSLDGHERCNEAPRWSPDGTKIAFASSRHPELGWDVYVMNADGTGVVNVSNNPSADLSTNLDDITGWSPDGRVVMESNRTGTMRSYIVNADGSGIQPLFDDAFTMPRWSTDGSKVAAEKDGDIYVMNADGTGAVDVSNDPGFDGLVWGDPWLPDGSGITFGSRRTGNADVFVVKADGSGLTNVTNAQGDDTFLSWSPDGSKMLFAGDRSGRWELYLQNADGTGLVNLSDDPTGDDDRAIWVPKS